jgi:dUTP pyrophosphatase
MNKIPTTGHSVTRPVLKIKKLHPGAQVPVYATAGAGCFDLHAATVDGKEHIGSNVWGGYPVTCGTGLAFEIPEGWLMLIFSRSGHGFKHDTRLANCVGAIDSDYRGEVQVKLTCDQEHNEDAVPLFVRPGDRIAQAMLVRADQWGFEVVDELSETERGEGGFGSTGA